MSQRDVNAEGLEKSFATNVLGKWKVSVGGVRRVWDRCEKCSFSPPRLSVRCLHPHQESHSSAGEERRSQSGESETCKLLCWSELHTVCPQARGKSTCL